MRAKQWLLLAFLALVFSRGVLACSCGARPSIEDALRAADIVVVAELLSSEQHSTTASAGRVFATEDAKFRVVEVIKGSVKPGKTLEIRSELGPFGPCGVSAKNSPVWLESQDGTPTQLSGRWLIYGNGKEPFELTRCGRSAPMETVPRDELKQLRSLLDQQLPSEK